MELRWRWRWRWRRRLTRRMTNSTQSRGSNRLQWFVPQSELMNSPLYKKDRYKIKGSWQQNKQKTTTTWRTILTSNSGSNGTQFTHHCQLRKMKENLLGGRQDGRAFLKQMNPLPELSCWSWCANRMLAFVRKNSGKRRSRRRTWNQWPLRRRYQPRRKPTASKRQLTAHKTSESDVKQESTESRQDKPTRNTALVWVSKRLPSPVFTTYKLLPFLLCKTGWYQLPCDE